MEWTAQDTLLHGHNLILSIASAPQPQVPGSFGYVLAKRQLILGSCCCELVLLLPQVVSYYSDVAVLHAKVQQDCHWRIHSGNKNWL